MRGEIEIVMTDVRIEIEEIAAPMIEVVQGEKEMKSIDTHDHAKEITVAHQALIEDLKETKKKSRNQLKWRKSLY